FAPLAMTKSFYFVILNSRQRVKNLKLQESLRCFASLNMTRFHVSLRASSASAAINRQRNPKESRHVMITSGKPSQ
ncbi:MAG: hypothetical protein K2N54_06000, partial [Helicobacter sp.]|nr:hypothetical protein [Helicobacter sp.]